MPGVNLSQSMIEEERPIQRSFFDVGVIMSLVILVLVVAGWGGLRLYMNSLDGKIAAVEATLSASAENTQGDHIDRIADFDARMKYFSKSKNDFVDPQEILGLLEGAMVSGVILTEYEYDLESGESTLVGSSGNLKELAEQILKLKSEKIFSQVQIKGTDRDVKNRVTFTLKASL